MKIRDIVTKVDKSEVNKSYVSFCKLAEEMQLGYPDIDQEEHERLTSYFIGSWYCTDSCVGYKVYFFDDKPVAFSSQTGRKMTECIEWLSTEAYLEVKKYIITFINDDDDVFLADLDEEIGETYKIEFNGQLFDYHKDIPLYDREHVKIIELQKDKNYFGTEQQVKIKFETEEEIWVKITDLDFPYNLIKN